MSFTRSTSTENFLNGLGIQYELVEGLKYGQLEAHWNTYNHGRPESQRRIEDAVTSYAAMFEQGSQAPAVILRERDGGLQVLDGMQRLMANALVDNTIFAGYIVKCQDKTAQKIRLAANLRINGVAPVDPDWTLEQLVKHFMIEDSDSAEDIAQLIGRRRSDVEKMYAYLTSRATVDAACIAEGKEPPTNLSKAVLEEIAKISKPSDFKPGPRKPVVDFLLGLDSCKFPNKQAVDYAKTFFGIKRIGSKNPTTQFNSKKRTFYNDPVVTRRREGGHTKVTPDENIDHAIKTLHTRVKEYKKQRGEIGDEDLIRKWNELDGEIGRWLRELCTNSVRRNVDPFLRQ